MALQRRASVNRFLNLKHGFLSRLSTGSLLWIFVLLATFNETLARDVFRKTFKSNDYKTAFRRASFYARRSWMGLHVSRDLVYVFCDGMSRDTLRAARDFLRKRQQKTDDPVFTSDLSYVSACIAIEAFGKTHYRRALEDFSDDMDAVLQEIETRPAIGVQPMEAKPLETFDVENAGAALRDFARIMEEKDHRWFILSGTLLGAVREGNFLKHDYDIDVGVHAEETDLDRLVDDLKASPCFSCGDVDLQTIFRSAENDALCLDTLPVFLKLVHKSGIHLDIFVHHTEATTTWHASSLFRWDNSTFDLAEYRLAEISVLGPRDFDRYLTENYGDWRVPKTKFQSSTDTTNQRVVQNPLSAAIFLRRAWLSKRHDPEGAAALIDAMKMSGMLTKTNTGELRFNDRAFLGRA